MRTSPPLTGAATGTLVTGKMLRNGNEEVCVWVTEGPVPMLWSTPEESI